MSLGAYLLGVVLAGASIGSLALGTHRVRRRLVPSWAGSTGGLADVIGVLTVLVLVPQVVGAIGAFGRWPITVVLVAVGLGAAALAGRPPRFVPGEDVHAPPRATGPAPWWGRVVTGLAFAIVVFVVGQWSAHVIASYSHGIRDGDSLWYHLPFAANYVQSHWTTRPLFTNADTLVTYFPANLETINGVTMAWFGRDVMVPVLNLVWLGLSLLAGWTIGRRYGAPAVGMAAVALVMSTPVMAATQAGTARNDVIGIALFLSAVALLLHSRWHRGALVFAGCAAGLALGVKLSVVAPVAFLTVGALVVAPQGRRRAIALPWLVPIVGVGSFWYLRNLARVSNPLPWTAVSIGPVSLPSVYTKSFGDTAVADRFGEPGAWGRLLRPGMEVAFGPTWWALLGLVVVVPVAVLVVGRGREARMLAVVAFSGIVAYVMMPNGAPDSDTVFRAIIFGLNVRYALPAVALALVLMTALPRMDDARFALGATLGIALLVLVQWTHRDLDESYEWIVSNGQRVAGFAIVVAVILLGLAVWLLARCNARAVTAAALLVVVLAGYVVQRDSFENRYRTPTRSAPASEVWAWAQTLGPSRIGIAGDLFQYPYVGPELANVVRYVGIERADGGFRSVRSCREWRQALADGDFDYAVLGLDFVGGKRREIARYAEWTRILPGAQEVFGTDQATVFKLGEQRAVDACP